MSRFPSRPSAIGLGVGLDMPWDGLKGFAGDRASPAVLAYLKAHADQFSHLFVSWQPRDRGRLAPSQYFAAYDHLFGELGERYPVRALHHTALNMGALEPYDRSELLDLTNALVERYRFQWVNEDLGLWSLNGKSLPYPLPPYLTESGLRAAIRNVRDVQERLTAPLLVEFPGFSDGLAFFIGRCHAYDFFRRLAEEADVAVTLDTGHLLSYQWLLGRRGRGLFDELERLPLDHCFEIHLSGCEIERDRFHDRHHGVLLDEQVELLEILVPLCPNLRAVTYEDPVFDESGASAPVTNASFDRLKAAFRKLSCAA
jgi:uncharacterized protein (UPF0276 family)